MNTAPQSVRRWALPILIVGALCIAFSPIFVRLSETGPVATAVARIVLAQPVFWLVLWLRPQDRIAVNASGDRDLWILMLGGLFFAGDLALWHWSILLTSVANATVTANLMPVFVVLAGWLLFKERVSRLFLVGLALAIGGISALVADSITVSSTSFLGTVLGVVTSWFYAGYMLTVARVRKRVSATAIMAVGGLVTALILFPIARLTEGQIWPVTLHGWLVILGLAFITQVLGQTLIALSLAHVPAGFGSAVLLLQPALAALIAWQLFDEPPSALQWLGGVAILAGLELARRGTPKTS